MARLLGDYVHYNYDRYLKYGPGENAGDKMPRPSVSSIVETHRDALRKAGGLKTSNRQMAEEIERRLNFFYGGAANTTYKDESGVEHTVMESMIKAFETVYPEAAKQIDFSTLGANEKSAISITDPAMLEKISSARRKKYSGKGERASINNLLIKYNTLIDIAKVLSVSSKTSLDSQTLKTIKRIEHNYDDIAAALNSLKNEGRSIVTLRSIENISKTRIGNFITAMDDLFDTIKAKSAASAAGIVGEQMALLTAYIASINIDNYVGDLSQELIKVLQNAAPGFINVGTDTSAKVLDADRVFGYQNANGGWVENFTKNINSKLNYTQDKIDVVIEVDGEPQNLSVKNYNISADQIHILSGSSFLKYLQLYQDFGNHYLNIVPERVGNLEESGAHPKKNEIQQMQEAAAQTVAVHALIGGLLGKKFGDNNIVTLDTVQYLVINLRDGVNTKFKVYPVDELLEKITEKGSQTYSGTANKEDIKSYRPKIYWLERTSKNSTHIASPRERILKLLGDMHNVKLQVSLNTSALGT